MMVEESEEIEEIESFEDKESASSSNINLLDSTDLGATVRNSTVNRDNAPNEDTNSISQLVSFFEKADTKFKNGDVAVESKHELSLDSSSNHKPPYCEEDIKTKEGLEVSVYQNEEIPSDGEDLTKSRASLNDTENQVDDNSSYNTCEERHLEEKSAIFNLPVNEALVTEERSEGVVGITLDITTPAISDNTDALPEECEIKMTASNDSIEIDASEVEKVLNGGEQNLLDDKEKNLDVENQSVLEESFDAEDGAGIISRQNSKINDISPDTQEMNVAARNGSLALDAYDSEKDANKEDSDQKENIDLDEICDKSKSSESNDEKAELGIETKSSESNEEKADLIIESESHDDKKDLIIESEPPESNDDKAELTESVKPKKEITEIINESESNDESAPWWTSPQNNKEISDTSESTRSEIKISKDGETNEQPSFVEVENQVDSNECNSSAGDKNVNESEIKSSSDCDKIEDVPGKKTSSLGQESNDSDSESSDDDSNTTGSDGSNDEEKENLSEDGQSKVSQSGGISLMQVSPPETPTRSHMSQSSVYRTLHSVKRNPVEFRNPFPSHPTPDPPKTQDAIIKEYSAPKSEYNSTLYPPKQAQLRDLILASKDPSLSRRSNACGAIKVLALKEKSNQVMLARTIGLIDAIIFAALKNPQEEDPEAALIARTRATLVLQILAQPKGNRRLVFEQKGLPTCLLRVINEDAGEARLYACSALALLGKTEENRDAMVKVDGLVSTLSKVVRGKCDTNGILIDATRPEEEQQDGKGGLDDKKDVEKESGNSNLSVNSSFSSDDSDSKKNKQKKPTQKNSAHPPTDVLNIKLNPKRQLCEKFDEFLSSARANACAALLHLSKHCSVSVDLCSNATLLTNLIAVAKDTDSIHTRCLEILCNLTRFPSNNAKLVNNIDLIECLLKCARSKMLENRVWSMRSFQNLTSEALCKTILATPTILNALSVSAMRSGDEQQAAVGAILNLSTEPKAVVPITNTRNVVATLVHLAHSQDSSEIVCHMACDALSTVSMWLQGLAGSATIPNGVEPIPLPTHLSTGWMRWD